MNFALPDILKKLPIESELILRKVINSKIFDHLYYNKQINGNFSLRGAIKHYLQEGWKNKLNPHYLFDTAYYLEKNADITIHKICPLTHFLYHGFSELRDPHPLFDMVSYDKQYKKKYSVDELTDIIDTNYLSHYLSKGFLDGLEPHVLFDAQFYLANYPDIVEAKVNPLVHYLEHGYLEYRIPHPLFDVEAYYQQDSSIKEADLNPLLHYLSQEEKGKALNPNKIFDNKYYRKKNGALNVSSLEHYLKSGVFNRIALSKKHKKFLNKSGTTNNNFLLRGNWRSGNICIVSHDASRTGAPLIILKVLKFLVEKYHFKATVLLLKGGEIREDFETYASEVYDLSSFINKNTSTVELANLILSVLPQQPLFTIVNSAASHKISANLSRLPFLFFDSRLILFILMT